SKHANRLIPSPDNKWLAFIHLHKAYLAPLLLNGQTLDLDNNTKAIPIAQITKDAGLNLHWSRDSEKIHWTLGDEYFTNEVKERFTFVEGAVDSIGPITESGQKIGLTVQSDVPSGTIAFTNARIITMKG